MIPADGRWEDPDVRNYLRLYETNARLNAAAREAAAGERAADAGPVLLDPLPELEVSR